MRTAAVINHDRKTGIVASNDQPQHGTQSPESIQGHKYPAYIPASLMGESENANCDCRDRALGQT